MPRKKQQSVAEQVVAHAKNKNEPEVLSPRLLIPTGSTLLNLGLSDTTWGGYIAGTMVNDIGDSSSGKTIKALTMCAEINELPQLDEYRLIYDDAEHALAFDMERMFGQATAERIEPPAIDEEGEDQFSNTIQDFHENALNALDADRPCIYILDSFDSLTSDEELDKVEEEMEARRKGKEVKGSYGMAKAKRASALLRQICSRLKDTKSLLLIISQTRDSIDPMSFQKKTRSGGRALDFYASHITWLAVGRKHKSKERVIGVDCRMKVTKNKLTGKVREVEAPIFYDYGVDDIGSCVDWLLREKVWPGTKQKMKTKWGDMSQEKLIRHIENNGLEDDLRELVGNEWGKIEKSLRLNRKRRFA